MNITNPASLIRADRKPNGATTPAVQRYGRDQLHGINHYSIAILTIVGLLADCFQYADLMLGLAVIQWLWWDECDVLEERMIGYLAALQRAIK